MICVSVVTGVLKPMTHALSLLSAHTLASMCMSADSGTTSGKLDKLGHKIPGLLNPI